MFKKRWMKIAGALIIVMGVATAVYASTYQVKQGDTLYALSKRFKVTVAAIAAANHIANPNLIYAGQTIEIPDGNTDPTPEPPTGNPGTYTVKAGDTLYRIAAQFGTTVSAIVAANHIINPSFIYVGQVLIIPGGTGTPPSPTPTPGDTDLELGGQSHGFDHIDLMRQASMNWIKIQYKWSPGDDPNTLASRIQAAHDNNLKILLSITGATNYPAAGSIDFNSFTDFVRAVAALDPDAIEIWNEMNIDFEWPAGEINPSTYVNSMLRPAYTAIKEANADVMVISGALAPTGFDNGQNAWADNRYLAGMNTAGAASYMDCVGVHHNAGATAPNVTTGHPGGSHYSWYFRPTLDLYYNAFGGARPVCFTEIGYLSAEGFPGIPTNFSWASGTSVQEHAQWLGDALRQAIDTDHVRLFIVYNVDFTEYDVNGDPQAGYAILRPDGNCPACATLSAAIGGG